MTTETKKFIAFPKTRHNKASTFLQRAKKHIFKGGKKNKNLSQEIDKVVYGVL
ncbi:MAG: hypothetical protein NTV02_03725 [Candidatus Zambryskibacteria bacterium]|nr:hypothetical protein [Candidatus Zambryskibacteria bacterium]